MCLYPLLPIQSTNLKTNANTVLHNWENRIRVLLKQAQETPGQQVHELHREPRGAISDPVLSINTPDSQEASGDPITSRSSKWRRCATGTWWEQVGCVRLREDRENRVSDFLALSFLPRVWREKQEQRGREQQVVFNKGLTVTVYWRNVPVNLPEVWGELLGRRRVSGWVTERSTWIQARTQDSQAFKWECMEDVLIIWTRRVLDFQMPCTLLPPVAKDGMSDLLTTCSELLLLLYCCQGFSRRTFRLSLSVSAWAGASYYFPDNYIHLQNSETMAWKGHSAAAEEEGVKIDSGKGHVQVQEGRKWIKRGKFRERLFETIT